MVGRDMSANLGGMLTQIGQSVGERAKAADPVIAAATKPKGDMKDPNHLQRLAQWASSNGDGQAASMYMQQSRMAMAEQREQNNLEYNAGTAKLASDGVARAGEGDVTNLDRAIASMQERVANSTTTQQQAQAQRALENLQGSREGAVAQQVQNHAQAVGQIDAALADESLDPTARKGLSERKEELLSDPKVQEAKTEMDLNKWRQGKAQEAMEEDQYVTKNMPALMAAKGNPEEVERLISAAPGKAQSAMRSAYNEAVSFDKTIADSKALVRDTSVPTDFKKLDEQIAQVPEQLRAGVNDAAGKIRDIESRRSKDGTLTTADRTALSNARAQMTSAMITVQTNVGYSAYQAAQAEVRKNEEKVAEAEFARDNYVPDAREANARAREKAEQAGDYITVGADKRGKGGRTVPNTGKYLEGVKSEMRKENLNMANARLRSLGVEVAEPPPEAKPLLAADQVQEAVSRMGLDAAKAKAADLGYTEEQIAQMFAKHEEKAVEPEEEEVGMPLSQRTEPLPGFYQRGGSELEDRYNQFQENLRNRTR